MTEEDKIRALLRDVPDFPKEGILFKDITPLLADADARKMVVEMMVSSYADADIDVVVAVEARGFIFGALLAEALHLPFVPIRKSGKLPFHTVRQEYALEYGTASIEMHQDAIKKGDRVLLHDDLLATGGTASAAANLVNRLGGEVAGFSFVINLSFLPGEQLLFDQFGLKPHYLVSF